MKYDLSNSLDKQKAITAFKNHLEKGNKVELKKINPTRSLQQNAYLHVCLSLAAIHFGYTLSEMKVVYKRKANMFYEKFGEEFMMSTAELKTDEMTGFIELIRTHNGKEGNYIPTSEEYLTNRFSIDREIEMHKEFLN